jgi:N-methylhydantoinase B/oxoprolinase/acetone carboxylase alpha subunit
VSLSILAQHRTESPYGMRGGLPGETGRQRVVRADGSVEPLGGVDACEMATGDRLILETPGGGGWGEPVDGRAAERPAASSPAQPSTGNAAPTAGGETARGITPRPSPP